MGCGAGAKGCDSSAHQGSLSAFPVLGDAPSKGQTIQRVMGNEDRLVVASDGSGEGAPRMYKLNAVYAAKIILGKESLPENAQYMTCWGRPAACGLWEKKEGLHLNLKALGSNTKKKILTWSGHPANNLVVDVLPTVQLISKHDALEHETAWEQKSSMTSTATTAVADETVEVIDIPEEHKTDPTELSPFIVKWEVDHKPHGFVIGCEDESSCNDWVAHLKLYSNICRRFCSTFMWKFAQNCHSELPDTWQENPELGTGILGDLRNWRRRLVYLEQLQNPNALCIRYNSERFGVHESIASVLMCIGDEKTHASIKRFPPIYMSTLAPAETQKISESVSTYNIAVWGHILQFGESHNEIVLPTILHGFEVRQPDDSFGGRMHTILACEDVNTCENWLAALDAACQQTSNNSDQPSLIW